MDQNESATLLDLAIQSLLNNEPAAIQALGEIPRDLFIPLFIAAFKGRHKKTLTAMVKAWPFFCLHIGKLSVYETHDERLRAMIDGLQDLPDYGDSSRGSKLKILDLRLNSNYKITCPVVMSKSPVCFHACPYSQYALLKCGAPRRRFVMLGPENRLFLNTKELLVDISLDSTLRANEFLSLLLSKVDQSLGSLHLCCRDLQISKLSNYKDSVKLLKTFCIDHLTVNQALLSEVTKLLSHMVQLDSLILTKISFRSLNGKTFRKFLTHLEEMDSLKELYLSYFCLTDHLNELLRVLPNDLDFLNLPFCELSNRDFRFLARSPQGKHLKLLNLSHNTVTSEASASLQILLENLSGTLQHLELNHCYITDSTMSVLIPALSRCSHLQCFSFACNPITMPMLIRILQHLTPMMELKHVLYAIPVHCYERWYFHGNVDQEKFAEVKAQLKMMLQRAQRDDMEWSTLSE